jgi:hypothetical protein
MLRSARTAVVRTMILILRASPLYKEMRDSAVFPPQIF